MANAARSGRECRQLHQEWKGAAGVALPPNGYGAFGPSACSRTPVSLKLCREVFRLCP